MTKASTKTDKKTEEGYKQAVKILEQCCTPHGLTASPIKKANYQRIWGRDSVIMGIATLYTGNEKLISCFKESLLTLAKYQGKHGEIPSNVSVEEDEVSYGKLTGRVDADLWFVIGCVEYYRHTKDHAFLENIFPAIKKCIWLLGAWEFNLRDFIYVPQTGDWADEYIHHGYILFDQLLYYRALKNYAYGLECIGEECKQYKQKSDRLKKQIDSNYWLLHRKPDKKYIYHEILFKKGKKFFPEQKNYWLSFFSPVGYGYRFDALANVLVSLFGIAAKTHTKEVDQFINERFGKSTNYLLPAFHPVIDTIDKEWDELQMSFSYTFRNKPYEYHNGGLWPMVTGFYVMDLAKRGKKKLAEKYLEGINEANKKSQQKGGKWDFHEFLHGKNFQPMGMRKQGWSAAAAVLGYHAVKNPKKIIL